MNSTQEVLGCASEGLRLSCIPGLFCRTAEEECWLIIHLFSAQIEATNVSGYLRQKCVTASLLALTSSQSRWAQRQPPSHLPQPPIEVGQKWKQRPNPRGSPSNSQISQWLSHPLPIPSAHNMNSGFSSCILSPDTNCLDHSYGNGIIIASL